MEDTPFDFNTPITRNIKLVARYNCGPSLGKLKDALDGGTAQDEFPIGTEIPDTWNGNDNPLIVGTYQNMTGADGQTYKAVGLTRKYLDPINKAWGSLSGFINYPSSTIYEYLNGEYLDGCSESLKNTISEVSVPWYNSSSVQQVSGKVQLFSGPEVYTTQNSGEGDVWGLWKTRTGLNAASDAANNGRVMTDRNGAVHIWWLRTIYSTSYVRYIGSNGSFGYTAATSSGDIGILPQFWILASEPIPGPVAPGSLAELKEAIDQGKDIVVGTEIPDTWNGEDAPLVVAQKLDSSNNSQYGGAEGVLLIRKWAVRPWIEWGKNKPYLDSTMLVYLNANYYDQCSDTLKNLLSDFTVKVYNPYPMTVVDSPAKKWHLMSAQEIGAAYPTYSYFAQEGMFLDIWKQRTGLSAPTTSGSAGWNVEISPATTGISRMAQYWLRTTWNYKVNQIVSEYNNYISYTDNTTTSSSALDVLPMCFIAKSPTARTVQAEPITASEYNALNITAEEYNNKQITAENHNTAAKTILRKGE